MDLDDVLHQIGDWDRYQHLLLWLVCLPACIPCGFNAFNQVFMDRTPDHWCRVPQLMDDFNLTLQQRKSLSIPQQVSCFKVNEVNDLFSMECQRHLGIAVQPVRVLRLGLRQRGHLGGR